LRADDASDVFICLWRFLAEVGWNPKVKPHAFHLSLGLALADSGPRRVPA
jgi:hypothetical protein